MLKLKLIKRKNKEKKRKTSIERKKLNLRKKKQKISRKKPKKISVEKLLQRFLNKISLLTKPLMMFKTFLNLLKSFKR